MIKRTFNSDGLKVKFYPMSETKTDDEEKEGEKK